MRGIKSMCTAGDIQGPRHSQEGLGFHLETIQVGAGALVVLGPWPRGRGPSWGLVGAAVAVFGSIT
jgi:hypothetical protein